MIIHTFPELSLPGSPTPHLLAPDVSAWNRSWLLLAASTVLAGAAAVEAATALWGAAR